MNKTRARVLMPNRKQMEFRASDLESLLPEGHRARLVWAYVERQDLARFYADIRAVEGGVGRSPIAPEILLALWLYATIDGVGSDQGQMAPMVEQVTERCGRTPEAWLVDGGFVGHEQIDRTSEATVVYGPVPEPKDKTVAPYLPKPGDSAAVAAWRERMGTADAKAIYKKRAASAECVNAQSRNRGLQQFKVRGLAKVKCVMPLFALAHNLMRMASLAPELLGIGTGAPAIPGMTA